MLYNIVFTGLPPIVMAVIDQHIPATAAYKVPQMYLKGIHGSFFSSKLVASYLIDAVYQVSQSKKEKRGQ